MADEQDKGESTTDETAKAGSDSGQTPKTFTESDLQREADRRVTAAQKAWRAELDAAIADKTKDAESKLAEVAARAEEAERYASFVESATASGIRNAKAAYLVAKHGDYFDKKGGLELDRFKKDNPEFFSATTNANAGAGTGTTPKPSMNDAIRAAAGIRGQ